MAFGTWSRLMAEHWPNFHFAYAYYGDYQRPLFYVLQGSVWRVFGFHQSLGRVLSLSFAVLLLVSLGWLAACIAPRYRWLAATLAALCLLMVTPFDVNIAAGLTDVPVAALVTLTAALLVGGRKLGRFQLPLV